MKRKRTGRLFDIIQGAIDVAQEANRKNPDEPTASGGLFDVLRERVKEVQQGQGQRPTPVNPRSSGGRTRSGSGTDGYRPGTTRRSNPKNIFDILLERVEDTRQANEQNPDEETAPDSIFDYINEEIEKGRERQSRRGLDEVIEEYNIDITGIRKSDLRQIREDFLEEREFLFKKYAKRLEANANRRTSRKGKGGGSIKSIRIK